MDKNDGERNDLEAGAKGDDRQGKHERGAQGGVHKNLRCVESPSSREEGGVGAMAYEMNSVKMPIDPEWEQMAMKYHGQVMNEQTIVTDAQVVGTLGEMAFAFFIRCCGLTAVYMGDESRDYDFRVMDRKIDIKTCRRDYPFRGEYELKIPAYQRFQNCDCYVFINLYGEFVEILGYMPKHLFWDHEFGYNRETGETFNGYQYKKSCRVLNAMHLIHMDHFGGYLEAQ